MKKYLRGQPFTPPQYLLPFHHFMLSVEYIELTEQHNLVRLLVAIKALFEIYCICCISYFLLLHEHTFCLTLHFLEFTIL